MGLVGTVVDAAIGWMVQTILGSFFSPQMQEWTHQAGLAQDVEMLESEMKSVQIVVAAAEGRRIDSSPLSDSLHELKELLYDAEDVMDELDYYRIQHRIEGKGSHAAASINPEGSCASSYDLSFFQRVRSSMNKIISLATTGRKRKREDDEPTQSIMLPLDIKHDISKRISGIVNRLRIRGKSVQGALQLEISGHNMVSKQWRSMARSSRLTTSIPIERKVYGRDVEKDSIVELLMKGKTNDLGVLPLVGIGGVGKTTLARFVYDDQRIKDHFDLRMWVCVSDNFNEQRLTREVLELVCKDRQGLENITSFDALHQKLSEKIRGKRFLLVLDDMWEDRDRSRWDVLLAPLKRNEATGCMILATTRMPSVARMIGTMSKVEVNGLDETEFWSLFKAWAFFGNENQEADPALLSIGKQIAKALKGIPLAARSVGALLNRSVSFEHWRKVQSKWKSLLKQDDDILAILKFSYEFLPVHLQHCFSYCSVFPKDHKFTEKKLVCAWISQNFVKRECHTKILEETGKEYLDNLVDWGFFEEFELHYVMHDLMHDLAQEVSSNECATLDILHYQKISPSIRHLSIITSDNHEEPSNFPSEKFEGEVKNMGSLQKLRTLIFFGKNSTMLLRSLNILCKESKRLRLLRIYVTAGDISSTFSLLNPYHIRYIEFIYVGNRDITNTYIPQALTQFYHLQVLDTFSFPNLVVPTGMNNLINLRHIISHDKVDSTIASVGNLTSLQELTFKVRDAGDFDIRQLGSMNELITLGISQLENVKTKEEAKSARLIDKEHLKVLSMSWNDNIMSPGPEPTEDKTRDDVLEGLEPHQNLKHLELSRYSGSTSPSWLATKVTSLQELHLENCREWRIVQSLEMLPVLRELKLIRMWNLMEVSIPSFLEELVLVNMPKLEKCVGTYGLDLTSHLRVLTVKGCPQLSEFTLFHNNYFHAKQKSCFPSLKKLTIDRCHHIIAWKILPMEEMQALKKLELIDVPVIEELSVPSLEELVLIQMPSLQSCNGITSSLHRLTIHDCPSLIVPLPIPSCPLISNLSIKGLSAFPTMEILGGMFIIKSKELIELDVRIVPFHNLKSIRKMYLEHCPNLTYISSEGFNQLIALEDLTIRHCPNLLQPYIMSELVDECYPVLPSLKVIEISSCGIAGRWLTQMLTHLQTLEYLELCDCPQIRFLSISQPTQTEATSSLAFAETTSARDKHVLNIPCNVIRSLERLEILKCPDLEFSRVNGGFGGCTSLVTLKIEGCPKLVSSLVAETNDNLLLPTSIEDLTINHLPENLQSYFPKGLEMLRLSSSQYLKSVQLHSCKALEDLQIWDCPQLGVLEGLQHLSSLRRLHISMNPELSCAFDLKLQEQGQGGNRALLFPLSLGELKIEYLPEDSVVHSRLLCLPSITKLGLCNSPDLKSLQLGYCTSLQQLEITNCKSLASIDGFHSIKNLRSLSVLGSPSIPPCLQLVSQQIDDFWCRLYLLEIDDFSVLTMTLCKQLTPLRWLTFKGNLSGVSLTEEQERALQLLTSLRRLVFEDCQNLVSLPSNLRSLDSLEFLLIIGCPSILRLPEMGLPPSLEALILQGCSEELCTQCRMAKTEKLKVRIWH
ncbi:hypothetical protein ABZP36_032450 [Zizania latifolia]